MRQLLIAVAIIASATGFACDGGGTEPAPPAQPALSLSFAEDEHGYLWDERIASGARYFIYDASADTIRALIADETKDRVSGVSWIDEQELLVTLDSRSYSLNLDGRVLAIRTAQPTPAAYDVPVRAPTTAWTAERELGQSGVLNILIRSGDGTPVFRVGFAANPIWFKGGDFMAFGGGIVCGGYRDLFRLDVDTGMLTNLTERQKGFKWSELASPDSSSVTYSVVVNGDDTMRLLQNVDVMSARITTLIEISGAGTLTPIAWNPNGKLLLLTFYRFGKSRLSCTDPPRVERLSR